MTKKHGLLRGPDGTHHLLYTVEAPESWAEDFGEGTLVGGKATVTIDPLFASLIEPGYHVFLTPHTEDGNALAVTERRADGFTVKERNKGTSGGTFSWRLVGKPKGGRWSGWGRTRCPRSRRPRRPCRRCRNRRSYRRSRPPRSRKGEVRSRDGTANCEPRTPNSP